MGWIEAIPTLRLASRMSTPLRAARNLCISVLTRHTRKSQFACHAERMESSLTLTCLDLQFRHPFRDFRWNRIRWDIVEGFWASRLSSKRCALATRWGKIQGYVAGAKSLSSSHTGHSVRERHISKFLLQSGERSNSKPIIYCLL